MRTTLTLDEDVASRLVELAHRERKAFKTVVNDTLRRGLGGPAEKPFRVRASTLGLKPGFDDRKFHQLYDQLETERVAEKLKQGK